MIKKQLRGAAEDIGKMKVVNNDAMQSYDPENVNFDENKQLRKNVSVMDQSLNIMSSVNISEGEGPDDEERRPKAQSIMQNYEPSSLQQPTLKAGRTSMPMNVQMPSQSKTIINNNDYE